MNQPVSVDGLFEIVKADETRPAPATGRLILVCRGGRLFGADPKGRVYLGRLFHQKQAVRLSALKGTYKIPLRRTPMRGGVPRNLCIHVPITGEVDPLAHSQNATVSVGGKKIDIEITYLGPLPP